MRYIPDFSSVEDPREERPWRRRKPQEPPPLWEPNNFRRPFFHAIGTAEWQAFAKSAHTLAKKEGP
jgi:hypothetical protein